jgi:hypothetical protein
VPGHPFQVTLDSACAWKQLAIHLIEIIVGCVEHETAGDADGNADRSAVVLDSKALHDDWTLLSASSRTRVSRRACRCSLT